MVEQSRSLTVGAVDQCVTVNRGSNLTAVERELQRVPGLDIKARWEQA